MSVVIIRKQSSPSRGTHSVGSQIIDVATNREEAEDTIREFIDEYGDAGAEWHLVEAQELQVLFEVEDLDLEA